MAGISSQAVKSPKANSYSISEMYYFRDKLMAFLWVTPKAQIINMQTMCQDKTRIELFYPTLKKLELEVANFSDNGTMLQKDLDLWKVLK